MTDPYYEDNYNDDYYDYDNSQKNKNKDKWYYTFDINQSPAFSEWLFNILNDIIKNPDGEILFPVNSWNPNTVNNKKFQHLGSNYNNEPIWKYKYWISDPINQKYKKHLQSNAAYFIAQPLYYKGLFDILN